jgi:predicted PurR-regulated permease PerM
MTDLHARRLLVFLVLLAIALTAVIVRPFWEAIFLGAVLAAALGPAMAWLTARVRGRRGLAAGLITAALLLTVLLPLAGVGAVVVAQLSEGVKWLRQTIEGEGVWGLVQRLPGPVEHGVRRVLDLVPDPQKQIQSVAGQGSGQAAAAVGGALAATGSVLFQAAMLLIAFFFFLVDGPALVAWLDARVPLRPGQFRTLIAEFRRTSVSVLVSTLGTAAVQTGVSLVGYLIARAPNIVFLTAATFILALIPALGGAFVVVAVALLVMATGHMVAGLFLVVWGVVVVSLADNVARPYLLKGGMELHGGLVFFALLGGLAVFGGVGLVLGPLVLTFLVSVVEIYRREFGGNPQATPAAGAPPGPPAAPPGPPAAPPPASGIRS